MLPHLRRLESAPEAWAPPEQPQQCDEASKPFWQLTYRLLLRGRVHEAWSVLETHSTNRRL